MTGLVSRHSTPIAAISAVALWGLAFPLVKIGLDDFSPILLGILRFAFASAVMMVLLTLMFPISSISSTLRREWRPLLILGLLYVTIPNITQNIGLQQGTSSAASVIQSSGPVLTLLFAVLLLGERMNSAKGVGTVVAMTGTIMLVGSGGFSVGQEDLVSSVLILISAISYGLAWVSAKRTLERSEPMIVIGLSIVLGTGMMVLGMPLETSVEASFTIGSVANLAVLGVFCAGLSSVLYLMALEKEEVSRMAFFIYLMPVFASLFAWTLRGESVAAWTVLCGVLIATGVALSNRGVPEPRGAVLPVHESVADCPPRKK